MALADSLLSAIVRADGDALVMHVGERPYVVVGTQTINISTHGLNLEAMTGMLAQLLTAEAQGQLEEFGAVEHKLPQIGDDRFSVVAARGGDDIWIEIRRRRPKPVAASEVAKTEPPTAVVGAASEATPVEAPVEAAPVEAAPIATAVEPAPEPIPESTPQEPPVVESVAEVTAQTPEVVPEPPAEPAAAGEAPAEPLVAAAPELEPATARPSAITETPIAEAAQVVETPILESTVVVPEAVEAPPPPVAEVAAVAEAPIAESPLAEPQVAEAPLSPISEVAQLAEPPVAEIAQVIESPIAEVAETPVVAESPIAEPSIVEPAPIEELSPMVEAVAELPVEETTAAEQPPATIAASVETPKVEIPEVKAAEPEPPVPTPAFEPEVEVPLTRTVRIEVPPRPAAARTTPAIDRLLRVAAARGATALYLLSDSPPSVRIDGDLRHIDTEGPLTRVEVETAIYEIAPETAHESIGRGEATEWIAEFTDVGRMRCTTFVDHRGPGVVLRMIATRAATAEQLGLSREVLALATEPQGLVLVAGPRAGGKSTLLSALVDHVNRQRADYIITLERQIRLLHDHKQGLISQREIRGGPDDLLNATRSALRENPGVLVIDDLVSPHMVPLLLTAAADGMLVFVSITAASTAEAAARFVELAPPETRKAVLNSMAESFRGAVAQVLLKKTGGGLIAAREVLLATGPVTRAFVEGQLGQLPATIDGGRTHGMVSFTDALAEFVRTGAVDVREAFRKAPDRERLLETLKRDGIDTTVVDRLA
jgi:twitching motility protein PilT